MQGRMRKIGKIIGIVLGVGLVCGLFVLFFLAMDEVAQDAEKGRAFAGQTRIATVQGEVERNEYGTMFSYVIFIEGIGFRTLDAQRNLPAPLEKGDRIRVTCFSETNAWCTAVKP